MSDPKTTALEQALRDNFADLVAYAERRVGDDAADVVADVFVAAWRHERKMPEEPAETRLWLFGITRNAVLTAQRGHARRLNLAARLRDHLASGAVPPPETNSQADAVGAALGELDDVSAELVRLIHWEGFGIAEAGQILGLKPSASRMRYARAKETLRDSLAVDAESRLR